MNWKKIELVPVRSACSISDPDGNALVCKEAFTYLGAQISCDGRIDSELSRRLGLATADFKVLRRFWNHANLSINRKLQIFMACIWSKLSYSLVTAWLTKYQRRKLDGFQNRCLRQIIGILPSFYSRVSNIEVLRRYGMVKFSNLLLEQQLLYFGKLVRLSDESLLHDIVLQPSSVKARNLAGKRRRGRPHMSWINEVYQKARNIVDTEDDYILYIAILDITGWRSSVRYFCRQDEVF